MFALFQFLRTGKAPFYWKVTDQFQFFLKRSTFLDELWKPVFLAITGIETLKYFTFSSQSIENSVEDDLLCLKSDFFAGLNNKFLSGGYKKTIDSVWWHGLVH